MGDLVQRSVTKNFDQGFVTSDDNKIVATLGEVVGCLRRQLKAPKLLSLTKSLTLE